MAVVHRNVMLRCGRRKKIKTTREDLCVEDIHRKYIWKMFYLSISLGNSKVSWCYCWMDSIILPKLTFWSDVGQWRKSSNHGARQFAKRCYRMRSKAKSEAYKIL